MEVVRTFIVLLLFRFALLHGATTNTKHYIIYMGHHSHPDSESVIAANHEMLASKSMFLTNLFSSSDGAREVSVHHYTKSFRGFSAMLTPDQAQQFRESDLVVSMFESRTNEIHTTRSWNFLEVDSIQQYNYLPMSSKADVVVGLVDTGARFYSKGFEAENGPLELLSRPFFRSARDSDGHGTHTSSTVAGSMVANVSLFGIGGGTARGGAPSARLSIYKACWFNLCSDADILSALDDAINDGVDIISLSLGPVPPQPSYFQDANSIGTFHAFQKGILVCASAGNSGFPGTATNVAPWILTVAASTMDRELRSNVNLGNSKLIKGFGINHPEKGAYFSLIAGSAAAAPGIPPRNASFCKNNTLDPTFIKGKIVICTIETITEDRKEKGLSVKQGGGVGMILVDPIGKDVGMQFVVPSTVIGQEAAGELQAYMGTEKNPVGRISKTMTVVFTKPAPEVAVFSSMGPNIITRDIIKPDITAPGVNILAAWSPVATKDTAARSTASFAASEAAMYSASVTESATVACLELFELTAPPFKVSKSLHESLYLGHINSIPNIKNNKAFSSCSLTYIYFFYLTATVQDNAQNFIGRDPNGAPTTPFDYGSGHINPVAAVNPGLVYDYDSNDIIDLLCSTGASPAQLKNLTNNLVYCKKHPTAPYDFNYPSIGVSNMDGNLSVHRTVTYYGEGYTTYYAKLDYPDGVNVSVTPHELKFRKAGEKMPFRVDFAPYKSSNGSFVFGALTWSKGIHRIRSPIGLNVISV
ncbi:hypothetical protein RJ640_009348 [Escallonia rubra]|uniref:Subtilisin-like protease n=1 Tax=Escallonia rubra TaxID=112253 RepID=A0AA88RDR8_9ASTE|nr:hypothetical protein RJ640_009348 [Escallonia rubra]